MILIKVKKPQDNSFHNSLLSTTVKDCQGVTADTKTVMIEYLALGAFLIERVNL